MAVIKTEEEIELRIWLPWSMPIYPTHFFIQLFQK